MKNKNQRFDYDREDEDYGYEEYWSDEYIPSDLDWRDN